MDFSSEVLPSEEAHSRKLMMRVQGWLAGIVGKTILGRNSSLDSAASKFLGPRSQYWPLPHLESVPVPPPPHWLTSLSVERKGSGKEEKDVVVGFGV